MRKQLLFLAAFAFAITAWARSVAPTAWRAYDNPEMGLSFSFPAAWGVVSRPVEAGRKSVLVIGDSVRIYFTRARGEQSLLWTKRRLSNDSLAGSRTVIIAGDTAHETGVVNSLFKTLKWEIALPALAIDVYFLYYLPERKAPDSAAVSRLLSSLTVGRSAVRFVARPACEGIADFRHSWFPAAVSGVAPIPEFGRYPAVPQKSRTPVRLDLGSNRLARDYRTRFREALRAGPNFAGHYSVVEWGCGTQCGEFGIVDDRTGRVLDLHCGIYCNLLDDGYFTMGLHYCANSRLLVTVGNYEGEFHSGRGEARFYELSGDSLQLVYTMNNRNSRFEFR